MKYPGPRIFILIWLLVLVLPPLRRQPWRQVVPQVPAIFEVDPDNNSLELPALAHFSGPNGPIQRSVDNAESLKGSLAMPAMAALVQRHPEVVWLKADALRFACQNTVLNVASTISWLPLLSFSMRKRYAEIAAQGSLQEPDNAFFPLMQALFLVSSGEKQFGMMALERAGGCPRFDDYARAEVNRRLEMIETIRPISWQQRLAANFSILLAHLGSFAELANYHIGLGQKAQSSGDFALAGRNYEAALTVGRVLRKAPDVFVRDIIGEEIEERVWNAATRAAKSQENRVILADKYALLARQWGVPVALAAQSRSDAENSLAQRLRQQQERSPFLFVFPVSPLTSNVVSQGPWLAARLAGLAWIGTLLWIFCGLLPVVWCQAAPARATNWCTGFAWGGLLFLSIACLWQGVGGVGTLIDFSPEPAGYTATLQHTFVFCVIICWTLLPLLWWLFGVESWWRNQGRDPKTAGKALVALPIWTVVHFLLWLCGVSLVVLGSMTMSRAVTFPDSLVFAELALGTALAGAYIRLAWKTWLVKGQSKPVVSPGLQRSLQCVAILGQVSKRIAFATTLAYLLVVLYLWPLNQHMDHVVRDFSTRGEVAVWQSAR